MVFTVCFVCVCVFFSIHLKFHMKSTQQSKMSSVKCLFFQEGFSIRIASMEYIVYPLPIMKIMKQMEFLLAFHLGIPWMIWEYNDPCNASIVASWAGF